MTVLKLTSLLLFTFFTGVAFAQCESFSGLGLTKKLCWNEEFKAFLPKTCTTSKKCQSLKFLKKTKSIRSKKSHSTGSPQFDACTAADLKVVVLNDRSGNQATFCVFPDNSLVDGNALDRLVE